MKVLWPGELQKVRYCFACQGSLRVNKKWELAGLDSLSNVILINGIALLFITRAFSL